MSSGAGPGRAALTDVSSGELRLDDGREAATRLGRGPVGPLDRDGDTDEQGPGDGQPSQRDGLLCADGQALVDEMGGRFDPITTNVFRTEPVPSTREYVTEMLLLGARDQVLADFATWESARGRCEGTEYETPDLGLLRFEQVEAPELGTDRVAYRYTPVQPPHSPWIEGRSLTILLDDGSSDLAAVVEISVTGVHDPPDAPVTLVDDEEWFRIAEAAVAKILSG